jgi:hypothetical protein
MLRATRAWDAVQAFAKNRGYHARAPYAAFSRHVFPRTCTPMNAVEVEQAISDLALQPFDATEFAFAFLAAFGNKDTTLKRLRAGNNNTSDLPGGALQRNSIHIASAGLALRKKACVRCVPARPLRRARRSSSSRRMAEDKIAQNG